MGYRLVQGAAVRRSEHAKTLNQKIPSPCMPSLRQSNERKKQKEIRVLILPVVLKTYSYGCKAKKK